MLTLQWRHNGRDSVSNHQPRECLLNRLIRCRSKKTSKLRVTGLCAGNSPETGEFPAQRSSNAENVPFGDVIMRVWIIQVPGVILPSAETMVSLRMPRSSPPGFLMRDVFRRLDTQRRKVTCCRNVTSPLAETGSTEDCECSTNSDEHGGVGNKVAWWESLWEGVSEKQKIESLHVWQRNTVCCKQE